MHARTALWKRCCVVVARFPKSIRVLRAPRVGGTIEHQQRRAGLRGGSDQVGDGENSSQAQNEAQWSETRMLLQIHDELVFECPIEQAAAVRDMVVAEMEGAMELCVPLKVDAHIGVNWFEGK